MDHILINDFYRQYKTGNIEIEKLESKIFKIVADNPAAYGLEQWDREDYRDFVSWLYPRIRNAVSVYVDTGASFDVYLTRIVKISAKEYKSRKTERSLTEYAAWAAKVPEMYIHQEEPDYLGNVMEHENNFEKIKETDLFKDQARNPRQILILILKCYCYISDDFIEKAASLAGVTKEKLKEMVTKMKEIRAKKDEKTRDLKERVHCQFYRCIVYEKRLEYLPKNSINALKLEKRLKKARIRYESMRRHLSSTRITATNGEVAKIIGISKGAVDSHLYSIKARWNDIILN